MPRRERSSTSTGRYSVHPAVRPPADDHRAAGRAREHEYAQRRPARRAGRGAAEQMEADLRELIATIQNPHLRRLLAVVFGEGSPTWASYRDAPGRQALPPGLPPRAARALPDRRAGGQRDLRDLPRHRPRRRGDRRAAARHRQARGLRGRGRRDLDVRPWAACTARSRSATTACGARSSGSTGFPPELEQAAAAHHPQPPRLARARQPGRPVHARGDARAHDRQPRRPPRQLRPDREGAPRGRAVVRLRQGRSAAAPTSPAAQQRASGEGSRRRGAAPDLRK